MRVPMTDPVWFPPSNVVEHYHTDFADGTKRPKKIDEMMSVAIAMAGMQTAHSKPYWIQGVSDAEQSPDVRTMCCDKPINGAAPWCYQQDIEVVTYTTYSDHQTLPEFVAATKLTSKSSYDPLTTILVNVQTSVPLGSEKEWKTVLEKTGKTNPVLVLGLVNTQIPLYRLASVHPPEVAIDYDPYDLLKKQSRTKVVKWSLGTKFREAYDANEKHCPFERFGIACRRM